MGQKVNPISLRLQSTNRHFDSCWYSNYFYKNLLTREIFLQRYLDNFLKLLKLPTGRYSIQHLQKKTQIFNFFCYPGSTRDWRSKVFGLKTNSFKKTKYFFKDKFKRKQKKPTKMISFYRTLNQLTLYKFQKKITSFQNFQLWSRFSQKSQMKAKTIPLVLNQEHPIKNFLNFFDKNSVVSHSFENPDLKKLQFSKSPQHTHKEIVAASFFFEKKQKHSSTKPLKLGSLEKNNNSIHQSTGTQGTQFFEKGDGLFHEFGKNHQDLIFFENLLVYKTLKSNLKQSQDRSFLDKEKTNSLVFGSSLLETSLLKKGIQQKSKLTPIINLQTTQNLWSRSIPSCSFSNIKSLSENLNSKNYLESRLTHFYQLEIGFMPFKVTNDWQHAQYLADEIVFFLQKRVPFRRLKNKLLKELSKLPQIRGVRITCSGRVGGKSKKAQRAKTECIKYGQTSLQVFSSKIDFSQKTALTSFGSVGVKVWICYN
nr:30S ribosomal protein S3 [Chlorella vulgaris]